MPKCLMVIKTSSLKFDDRLRKECIYLRDNDIEPGIVVLEAKNKSKKGKTEYGALFHSISLFTRKIFPHKRFLFLKVVEMYIKFFIDILKNRSDIVWFHDMQTRALIPLAWILKKMGYIKMIIWDQHELPKVSSSTDSFYKRIYKFSCSLSDRIITANKPRKEYLEKFIGPPEKIIVLENFPDRLFIDLPEGKLPESARKWLDGEDFLLAQGGANPDRNLGTLVEAVMKQQMYQLIVVGPYKEKQLKRLRLKWGNELDERILFFGAVPQMSLVNFIDHAKASVIFYENTSVNTWLCAPNRLYQALGRGTPVIVGVNPPMAELVHQFKCGIAIEDDGNTVESIQKGIQELDNQYERILENAKGCRKNWIWESQEKSFERLIPQEFLKKTTAQNNKNVEQISIT